MKEEGKINIDIPQYDQMTFIGRLKYFAEITDFRLCFKSDSDLQKSKKLVSLYRVGDEPVGTTRKDILLAKRIYDSSFHPDTGDKQNLMGRMCFQVPGGMVLTGAMLSFYKTNTAVIFWQWVNQSFNALVNYTNRNAKSPLTTQQMGVAYVSATSAALITALGLKSLLSKRSQLLQRFVPFVAVAASNMVNVPLMRQTELANGIATYDANNNEAVHSKVAAVKGISEVVFSRIFMACPGMTLLPFAMQYLEKYKWAQNAKFNAVFQIFAVGSFLIIMTPTACALFNQRCAISTKTLEKVEPSAHKKLIEQYPMSTKPDFLYFNKGL